MIATNLDVPRRALAIGAHPDDIEFGCSGTLAKWVASGCEVHFCVLTDGSKGSWDAEQDRRALIETRAEEQLHASMAIGAKAVHMLGFVDGELVCDLAARARVCEVIRQLKPDVVFGHDPWRRYRLHPDHRNAGFLAVEGIVAARDPHFFPDQDLEPWRPEHLLLWEADEIDHVESIDGFVDTKLEALLCHRSQWRSTMHIDADVEREIEAFRDRIRTRAAEHGAPANFAAGEAFKKISEL